jgi:hypothetical protein
VAWNYRGRGEVAEQENLDSEGAQLPQGKDKIDSWVAEIDKWVDKVDRGMGKGVGRGPGGADPEGEKAGSPPDPSPRPVD